MGWIWELGKGAKKGGRGRQGACVCNELNQLMNARLVAYGVPSYRSVKNVRNVRKMVVCNRLEGSESVGILVVM